jgi:uncharacterized membrane protein YjjB (DUF3815 family)
MSRPTVAIVIPHNWPLLPGLKAMTAIILVMEQAEEMIETV